MTQATWTSKAEAFSSKVIIIIFFYYVVKQGRTGANRI